MTPALRAWFILTIALAITTGQATEPFLQSLIRAGIEQSELNVVYFIAGKSVDDSLLLGDYPRLLVPGLAIGSTERKNRKIRIAAQSMVTIDGRDEPVNACLTYLLREIARIVNPGSNKFVLLVDRVFSQRNPPALPALSEGLMSAGVGYTVVLYFDGSLHSVDPVSVTRISFGQMVTFAPAELADPWALFRFDVRSLDGVRVSGMLNNFIPFSYIGVDGHWTGTDLYFWGLIARQLRLRLQLKYAKPGDPQFKGGMHSPAMRNGSVHFVATRDLLLLDSWPKLHLFVRDHLSLIVPRPFARNLIDALLQPFATELWVLIGLFVGGRVGLTYLTASMGPADGSIRTRWRYHELVEQLHIRSGWILLVSNVLKFVLIEAYLAQITSLLLTLRYKEGPNTLEAFVAAKIPILQPFGTQYTLFHVGPEMSARLEELFVRRSISELRQSTGDAYVELRSRVQQMAYGTEPFDAVTGTRNFYILGEPLAIVHFQFTFSRESAIKHVFERCLHLYEANGLRMHMEKYYERWAEDVYQRKQHGINVTVLRFHDLHSLWIWIAVGWCLSWVVFLAECATHYMRNVLAHRYGRRK